MADKVNNKDKNPVIDESILDETPPNINEPQKDEKAEDQDPNPDIVVTEEKEVEVEKEGEDNGKDSDVENENGEKIQDKPEEIEKDPEKAESQEQKDERYKQQQTEAQIQAARNRALIDKVSEADQLPEPTPEELKSFVAQDGVNWDELTVFEQATAKRTYLAEKRFALVNDAVKTTKEIDAWTETVDSFIDTTDGNPEFVELSSHEAEFRKFATMESHRGTPLDILLGAFLHNLPKKAPKRGSLFEKGGGGEKTDKPGKITDADAVANLRATNPKEYARQVKAGNIDLEL